MPEPIDKTMPTYRRAAPLLERGEGAWIFDSEGRRYLDWISGIGASCLGHGHAGLTKALAEQAATLGHVSNLFRTEPGERLSERLTALTGMDSVFYSNSGSEANETALKLSRKVQGLRGTPERQRFVALHGGFHGRTFGSLSVTAKAAYREPFGELLDVAFVEPGDLSGLEAALDPAEGVKPAALILEPIQGEGGLRSLGARFLQGARTLCDATGTILIHDEVQCGGGRTGTFLAADACGVKPDVVTLAKPLGAGLPIGATLARGDAAKALQPGDHGSTFGGGTLACRAALTVLDALEGGLQAHVVELGTRFAGALDELAAKHDVVIARRGKGLMQGLALNPAAGGTDGQPGIAAQVAAALFDAGVLACAAGDEVVRFLPPYILTAEDLDVGIARLDDVLLSMQVTA